MVAGAILAGGRAQRLGGLDKSALAVGNRSILDRQLELLRTVTEHVMIIANDPARFAHVDVPVFPDRLAGAGPLGGVYTALVEAPSAYVLIVACDMPFLTRPFLGHLVHLSDGVDAVVPRDAHGRHPLCACYASAAAPLIKARIDAGVRSVRDALDALDVRELGADELAPFDPDGRLLLNVNTPSDYATACAAAALRPADRRSRDPRRSDRARSGGR